MEQDENFLTQYGGKLMEKYTEPTLLLLIVGFISSGIISVIPDLNQIDRTIKNIKNGTYSHISCLVEKVEIPQNPIKESSDLFNGEMRGITAFIQK